MQELKLWELNLDYEPTTFSSEDIKEMEEKGIVAVWVSKDGFVVFEGALKGKFSFSGPFVWFFILNGKIEKYTFQNDEQIKLCIKQNKFLSVCVNPDIEDFFEVDVYINIPRFSFRACDKEYNIISKGLIFYKKDLEGLA